MMKKTCHTRFITAFVFFCCAFLAKAENKDLRIIYPANPEKTGKWEKLELGVDLPADIASEVNAFIDGKKGLNPFDPDQLSIVAVFVHEDEVSMARKIYGFYYEEYDHKPGGTGWLKKEKHYPFRVRFSPDRTGNWSCTVKIVKNKTEEVYQDKINFTCVESGSKGQIQIAHTNDARNRYLQFSESKDMFFPVGLNLVWSNLEELKPQGYQLYEKWFDALEKAKANYAQLSMLPFSYGIEWEQMNNYHNRLSSAWELDQLMDKAHRQGLYINMLMLIHDEFITGKGWIYHNNHWTHNVYNKAVNGKLAVQNPIDFFTDAGAKENFKKRLRYILARYGYSVNLPVIELLSEVDNAIPNYNRKDAAGTQIRKQFKEWFTEMKKYIQEDLGYAQKLVSVSYTQGYQNEGIDERAFSVADIILLHFYGRDKYTNFTNRYLQNVKVFKENAVTANKPVIFDEMGASVFPGLDKCSDITFHNSLWATALMGCFGTGQNWWWDNAILPNGYERNFKGISKFLEEENFTAAEFKSNALADNGKKFKSKTAFETYYLQSADGNKVTGWLHNTSFYWANLKNDNPCIAKLIEDNNGSSVDQADNTPYKKEYEKGRATGTPQAKKGYQLKMVLNPSTTYLIKWYNTVTGEPTGETQTVGSSSSGKIKFNIPGIEYPQNVYGDLGYKIVKFSR